MKKIKCIFIIVALVCTYSIQQIHAQEHVDKYSIGTDSLFFTNGRIIVGELHYIEKSKVKFRNKIHFKASIYPKSDVEKIVTPKRTFVIQTKLSLNSHAKANTMKELIAGSLDDNMMSETKQSGTSQILISKQEYRRLKLKADSKYNFGKFVGGFIAGVLSFATFLGIAS